MSNQNNIEIKSIELTDKDLEMSKLFQEMSPKDISELYLREMGITQEDFEALKNNRPKTSDQYYWFKGK